MSSRPEIASFGRAGSDFLSPWPFKSAQPAPSRSVRHLAHLVSTTLATSLLRSKLNSTWQWRLETTGARALETCKEQ